jgi:hypothetical protein
MTNKAKWIVTLSFLVASVAESQQLFRYVDQDGITILNSSIPADYVNAGYEVLDSRGMVIQVVPPKADEIESLDLVLEKSDTLLLTSYSDVVELEERRDRMVLGIEREINNIENDNRMLRIQLTEETAERDRLLKQKESEGLRDWEEAQLKTLESSIRNKSDIAIKLQSQSQDRSQDIVGIQNEYALKIERFIQLEQAEVDVRHTSLENSSQSAE